MPALSFVISLSIGAFHLSSSNELPSEVVENGKLSQNIPDLNRHQETTLLRDLIHYSHPKSLQSCNTDASSYASLSDFTSQNSDAINDAVVQNEQICSALQLESHQCYKDCLYYASPLTLLQNNDTSGALTKILSWYQMGGGPVGWYDTGNPDMCRYMDGTYCYTPMKQAGGGLFNLNLQEHGCCVPGSCTGEDAVKVLMTNQYCYQGYNLTYSTLFGNVLIANVCKPLDRDFSSPGCVIVILLFVFFLIAVIVASINTQHKEELQATNQLMFAANDEDIEASKARNVYDHHWFLYSFSIQHLWKLFTRRRPKDKSEFNFLDGIRVGSMSWVIWGHIYIFYGLSSPSNQATLMPFGADAKPYPYVFSKWYMMLAEYGFYSVDSFFYLSGFLAAFALCRKLKSYDKQAIRLYYVWVPLSYLNRLLRIFPMMAFILFVQFFVADQVPYGYRVTSRDANYQLCADGWYKVLLFYANLLQENDNQCMGHLWYIHCDMQLFLVLPWIILLFQWNKLAGLIASLLLFLVGIVIRMYFAIHYHFGANLLLPANPEVNDSSQFEQYFKPWTRMSPYFIGAFTLLLIQTLQERHFAIQSRVALLSVMSLSGFIMCCLVFWPYDDIKDAPDERWPLTSDQIYYALSRPIWGVALGLLSFGIVFKSKAMQSMMGTILSAQIYQPLGKLTYTMYLIHWMVLDCFFKDLNMTTYYEFWSIFGMFCAVWLVTMFCSLILWFVVEQPMTNLVGLGIKALIQKKPPQSQSNESELTNVAAPNNKTKNNNTNGNSILDKLLIEGGTTGGLTHSNSIAANNSYGGADVDNEYSSVKSN
eukprot:140792_1